MTSARCPRTSSGRSPQGRVATDERRTRGRDMTELTVRKTDEVFQRPDVDLTTQLGSVTFPNPVFTASGCAAAGQELDQFFDVAELGGVVTKSIMMAPRSGRAT